MRRPKSFSPGLLQALVSLTVSLLWMESYSIMNLPGEVWDPKESGSNNQTDSLSRQVLASWPEKSPLLYQIHLGLKSCIILGNLNARRDWGHALDYMRGAYSMMKQAAPDDYVLATGKTRSVRDFVVTAFQIVGIRLEWVYLAQSKRKIGANLRDIVGVGVELKRLVSMLVLDRFEFVQTLNSTDQQKLLICVALRRKLLLVLIGNQKFRSRNW